MKAHPGRTGNYVGSLAVFQDQWHIPIEKIREQGVALNDASQGAQEIHIGNLVSETKECRLFVFALGMSIFDVDFWSSSFGMSNFWSSRRGVSIFVLKLMCNEGCHWLSGVDSGILGSMEQDCLGGESRACPFWSRFIGRGVQD